MQEQSHNQLPPHYKAMLAESLSHSNWDWQDTQMMLLESAKVNHLPLKISFPSTLSVLGLKAGIEYIWAHTEHNPDNHEFAQNIVVDFKQVSVKVAGDLLEGDDESIEILPKKDNGREHHQKIIGSMHTHPGPDGSLDFSPKDITNFIFSDSLIKMVVTKFGVIMAIKSDSSVRPHDALFQGYLSGIENDMSQILINNFYDNLHKKFGLTFYKSLDRTNSNDGYLLQNINSMTGMQKIQISAKQMLIEGLQRKA